MSLCRSVHHYNGLLLNFVQTVMMNPLTYGDPGSFHLTPPGGQHFSFLVKCSTTLRWIAIKFGSAICVEQDALCTSF